MELTEALIITDVIARDKNEVLLRMADHLHRLGYVKESYSQAVVDREACFATGLELGSYNVAIPHTDAEHVIKSAVSVAVLADEVNFGIMADDESLIPVKLVFMLAMQTPHAQLKILQKLVAFLQNAENLENIVKERNRAVIRDFLLEKIGCFAAAGSREKCRHCAEAGSY